MRGNDRTFPIYLEFQSEEACKACANPRLTPGNSTHTHTNTHMTRIPGEEERSPRFFLRIPLGFSVGVLRAVYGAARNLGSTSEKLGLLGVLSAGFRGSSGFGGGSSGSLER